MIDANAISNLQMLMNIGDGRHAVLAELLHPEMISESENAVSPIWRKNGRSHRPEGISASNNLEVRGSKGKCFRLLTPNSESDRHNIQLTDNIVGTLDCLSKEEKAPLIHFAEGLAYHYNNLFMAIVGYISIVMFHHNPTHPAYRQLRECEELVHNTALLIRLLVDVFHRSQDLSDTAYPIDLTDAEIKDRIFQKMLKQDGKVNAATEGLSAHKILRIISAIMASRLKRTFQTLQSQVEHAFKSCDDRSIDNSYHRQIKIHTKRGIMIADALLVFGLPGNLKKDPIDLGKIVKASISNYQQCFSSLKINYQENSSPVLIKGNANLLRKMVLEILLNAGNSCTQGGKLNITILRNKKCAAHGLPITIKDKNEVHLIFEDNGPGLPEDIGIRAFDPFYCKSEGRKCRGLGLAAVSGIVREHKGKLKFFNRPEGGFVLRVELNC